MHAAKVITRRLGGALCCALLLLAGAAQAQPQTDWETDEAMRDTQAVAVGFNYQGSDWPITAGHAHNVVAWAIQFKSMGIPPSNVLLISDVPSDDLETWLQAWDAWHPDLRVAYARGPGGLGAALGDPATWPGRDADGTANARTLLGWGGHGVLGEGGLPSRLATPGGAGSLPLLTVLEALGEAHGWPTWRPGALPNVLAFIDACEPAELGTGADAEHPDLLGPDAERAAIEDLGAVVHATGASTGACQVLVDYGNQGQILQGAMGRAAMHMLPKAGGYEWNHDDLRTAIHDELVGAEVDVELQLVAPTSEPERRVLRARDEYWFDRSVRGEVYPTSDKTAAQFDLVADNGALLGVMVITGTAQKASLIHPSWYDAGFDRDTLYFKWAPGVEPFAQSFTAIPPLEDGKLLQTVAMDEPIGPDAPVIDDADVYPQRYWFPLTKPMTGFQPTFRMVAGGKVQKWLQIKTSTIKGRTVNDLVFYRHEDQPSETDPLLELRFERLPAGTVIDSPIHMIAEEPQQ